ncbi:DUF1778 domain-containing protein (plasmid) [Gordonia polyisoprenivorans]|uniref:type II toxin -antitoxin system TacA 1-like antitoxin n=1 Tax=Gordonia polyisoprenivorans TaxID=84595 RepID=UPI002233EB99|nr:DUF1778 domain-containing protein [uncultured Gordonia sp.]UZF59355.1 DUF1778 domain-containing protein [Gordonia polyisoprenivorans]
MADPRFKSVTVTMNMRMRPEVKAAAQRCADDAGVTLTDFVAAAIAEKAGALDLVPPTLRQEIMEFPASA